MNSSLSTYKVLKSYNGFYHQMWRIYMAIVSKVNDFRNGYKSFHTKHLTLPMYMLASDFPIIQES